MTRFDTADVIAQSYNAVPYQSHPFPQSHPARSAALASLFGLTPPDVATSRVLELGCAAGGNLIPMASAHPQATFVGVDLSPVQIAEGNARIAALGLTNITLRTQSILDLSPGHGVFDYIVCHGVYSWVPHPVRDAILRVASENLSDTGVAYISYNVHPGWRLRGVLRDAMLFHCGHIDDLRLRLSHSRQFLNQLAEITDQSTAYGQLLRQEAKSMAGMEDYYLIHEYLEHTNDPCYVSDFLSRAQTAGLAYLTEANLSITVAETFGPEKGAILRDLSGNRLDRMEQYIDFLTGRTFRQSLLVRQSQAPNISRTLGPARLDGLHLQGKVTITERPVEDEGGAPSPFVLRDAAGRTLTTSIPFVRDGLLALASAYPGSFTAGALAARVSGDAPTEADITALNDALFKMVLIGMVDISTRATSHPADITDQPLAAPLARADAQAGLAWTTNQRHEPVPLTVVERAVLPLLDGSNDTDALVAALRDRVREGALAFHRDGKVLTEDADLDASTREHLAHALSSLATRALLVAA